VSEILASLEQNVTAGNVISVSLFILVKVMTSNRLNSSTDWSIKIQPHAVAITKNTAQSTFRNRFPGLTDWGKPWPVELDKQSKTAVLIACNAPGFLIFFGDCFNSLNIHNQIMTEIQ